MEQAEYQHIIENRLCGIAQAILHKPL